jgi:hypothetical protein
MPRMSRELAALVACVAIVGGAARVEACASCGCGDPTLTASGVELPYKNRLRVTVDERYGSLSLGEGDDLERVQFLRSTLAVSWSATKWLTFDAKLPWLTSFIGYGTAPYALVNGLGDLELAGRFVLFRERGFAPHHLLSASAGLKMPTGYAAHDSDGALVSDDDQPGSGSWDPFGGVTYAWLSGDLLSVFASTGYRYTTGGWHGYRRGMSVGASAMLQVQPRPWGAVQVGIDGGWQAADRFGDGSTAPDTGGTVVYAAIGLLGRVAPDWLARAVVDVPAVVALNGHQTVGPQVAVSMTYDLR